MVLPLLKAFLRQRLSESVQTQRINVGELWGIGTRFEWNDKVVAESFEWIVGWTGARAFVEGGRSCNP